MIVFSDGNISLEIEGLGDDVSPFILRNICLACGWTIEHQITQDQYMPLSGHSAALGDEDGKALARHLVNAHGIGEPI